MSAQSSLKESLDQQRGSQGSSSFVAPTGEMIGAGHAATTDMISGENSWVLTAFGKKRSSGEEKDSGPLLVEIQIPSSLVDGVTGRIESDEVRGQTRWPLEMRKESSLVAEDQRHVLFVCHGVCRSLLSSFEMQSTCPTKVQWTCCRSLQISIWDSLVREERKLVQKLLLHLGDDDGDKGTEEEQASTQRLSHDRVGKPLASIRARVIRETLCEAIVAGHSDIAVLLIENGATHSPIISSEEAFDGTPPLNYAARYGNWQVIEALLAHNADVNGNQPYPALYTAVKFGQWQVAERLLEHGADPNVTVPSGGSILIVTAHYAEGLGFIKRLLCHEKGVEVNKRDNAGLSALYVAAVYQHIEIAKVLVRAGATTDGIIPGHHLAACQSIQQMIALRDTLSQLKTSYLGLLFKRVLDELALHPCFVSHLAETWWSLEGPRNETAGVSISN